jgi:hypothetical protein
LIYFLFNLFVNVMVNNAEGIGMFLRSAEAENVI